MCITFYHAHKWEFTLSWKLIAELSIAVNKQFISFNTGNVTRAVVILLIVFSAVDRFAF